LFYFLLLGLKTIDIQNTQVINYQFYYMIIKIKNIQILL